VNDFHNELIAAAYLSRVAEPANIPLWMLINELGYIDAANAVYRAEAGPELLSATESRRECIDPQADLDAAERNGIRLITPSHSQWPHFGMSALTAAGHRRAARWRGGERKRSILGELIPPVALWVKGNVDLATVGVRSIAIVGSRAATSYGEYVASEFSYRLSQHDVVVVSGGAYGIDAAAHRGVLAADGVSVLVSAGGLDRPYPAGNRQLYERTAATGLLISERPPGMAPHRQRFLSRNRLIAALGSATLLVEAARRSGALNTARYTRELGHPLLVVPGPITSAMSQGCHALMQRESDPANLVTSVAEVLAYCGPMSAEPDGVGGAVSVYDALDPIMQAVLDGFPSQATVNDRELAALSGHPLLAVRSALPVLVDAGLISHDLDGYRLLRASRTLDRRTGWSSNGPAQF